MFERDKQLPIADMGADMGARSQLSFGSIKPTNKGSWTSLYLEKQACQGCQ